MNAQNMSAVLKPVAARQPDYEVAIIGSGFAGLCMGIKLKESGQENFVIYERGDSVGGTWRDNHYPGACCDVPSHLYSFSFEQNPDWSRKYPSQPELYAYLKRTAEKYGLLPHIRFKHTVTAADFDDQTQLWRVQANGQTITARVVVSGAGFLSEPAVPDVPGLDSFKGKVFHSAQWDHEYDLNGKRVAVIGTGASAIQFVPQIAPQVKSLDVYQRTPPWIIPRPDRKITWLEKKLLHTPLKWLYRWFIYWGHEARVMGIVVHPALMKIFQKVAERHIRKQVKDPALQQKLTPAYVIGCKRILISNDWYPALQRPNVNLITNGIREIRENGVVTSDGQLHEVDTVILGTGFHVTDHPIADKIRGRNGLKLGAIWADNQEAYVGTVVNGFPNLYFIVGPNTGLGHSSMVFMIETQTAYIMKCLRMMKESNMPLIEVKPEVQAGYNRRLQERLKGSVWSTGCKSWYQNKHGKITTLWPGFTFTFWLRMREFRKTDYIPADEAA